MALFLILTGSPLLSHAGDESPDPQSARPLLEKLKDHQASLHGDKMPVATLLQALARQAEINIFVANNITDTIDVNLDNLSLYDIFQLLMETKDLHASETKNILFVEKKSDFQNSMKDVITKTICTKYGNSGNHIAQLKMMLSETGSISTSDRGNCLVVRDREINIARVEKILPDLDKPIPQVHIEAKIVSLSQEAQRRLGIKWGYDNTLTRNNVASIGNLSVSHTSNVVFGFIQDNLDLSIELQAMQQDNILEILSAPNVLVLDGQKAEIKQGKEIPYVTQSGDLINTSFREANLSLKVTPRIIQNKFIELDVAVTNDSVDQASVGNEPLINTQSITTKLFLEDSTTVVIGGIRLRTKDNQKGSVPFISKIPLLGLLFQNSEKSKEDLELNIFITPTIVNMIDLAKKQKDADPAEVVPEVTVKTEETAKKELLIQDNDLSDDNKSEI
ncbi:MAG: hypothetical protein KKB30_15150 [Proteobacteria bacterium]|nr:hypothetical protein [Pseudomonadota bacterium]MBU1716261.1 hypothetical protein [Pseudomonadota bacterium]